MSYYSFENKSVQYASTTLGRYPSKSAKQKTDDAPEGA